MKSFPVTAIKGIGPVTQKLLNGIGIFTTRDLIEKALKSEERKKLFKQTDLSLGDLRKWAGYATLFLVKGIGEKNAALLYRAGIKNVGQLSNANHLELSTCLGKLKPEDGEVVKKKSVELAEDWIKKADSVLASLFVSSNIQIENVSLKNLKSLDGHISDLLFYENRKQLIELGRKLMTTALNKAEEIRQQTVLEEIPNSLPSLPELNSNDKKELKNFLLKKGYSSKSIESFFNIESEIQINNERTNQLLRNKINQEIRFLSNLSKLGACCFLIGTANSKSQKILVPNEVKKRLKTTPLLPIQRNVEKAGSDIQKTIKTLNTALKSENFTLFNQTALHYIWNFKAGLSALAEQIKMLGDVLPEIENYKATVQSLPLQTWKVVEEFICLYSKCVICLACFPEVENSAKYLYKDELNWLKSNNIKSRFKTEGLKIKNISTLSNAKENDVVNITGVVKHTNETRMSELSEFIVVTKNDEIKTRISNNKIKKVIPKENTIVEVSGTICKSNGTRFLELTTHLLSDNSNENSFLKVFESGAMINEDEFVSTQIIQKPESIRNIIKNFWRK